ncbi:MAG: DUF547 domain-containing protein, partial [Chitinophagales bacterium]
SLITQNKQNDLISNRSNENGLVDYQSLNENPQELLDLLIIVDNVNISEADKETKKAFYINAYNLCVIKSVVLEYPISSPKEVPFFFDAPQHKIAGKYMSLNEIEKFLLGEYQDARLHFMLVCAALGCPKLANFAFFPEKIEEQITQQTHKVLHDSDFVKIDSSEQKIGLSQIFRWYENDFSKSNKNLRSFINKYINHELSINYKIYFYEYNWNLNDANAPNFDKKQRRRPYQTSSLLGKGGIEYKMFNNLYTQNVQQYRSTFFTSFSQFLYGVNKKLNVGFDAKIRAVASGQTPHSPLAVFQFREMQQNNRFGLTALGPKIKFTPFPKKQFIAMQSSILFPVNKKLVVGNEQVFIDNNGTSWWTETFFDKQISNKISLFAAANVFIDNIQFKNINQISIYFPLKAIFSYFPSSKTTVYALAEFAPYVDSPFNFYAQSGLGAKYEIKSGIELEALYSFFTNTYLIENQGNAHTFNIGFRFTKP